MPPVLRQRNPSQANTTMSNTHPDRAIFRRWPELADITAFRALGIFPTAVESNIPLGQELGIASLAVKRDDLSAGDYGGNKIRKLEFLLGDVLTQQKSHVVTFGGMGSNHAIATSLNCKKLGLTCGAVLTPEPESKAVLAALERHNELGTYIEIAHDYGSIREAADRLAQKFGPEQTCEIPFGGSSPIGTLGFVNAALELKEQIDSGDADTPDVIYLACGTTGSIAGLALGLAIADINCKIEAVQVTPDSLKPQQLAERLVTGASSIISTVSNELPALEDVTVLFNIRKDQLGKGYALPTEACKDAAELFTRATGLSVSLTYTAKALAALVADARQERLRDKRVMFWNTYNSQPWIS